MPTIRVNGGIINDQSLTGSLRFFKMTGPFAWTVSDGSVNLNFSVSGGVLPDKYYELAIHYPTTYFTVAPDLPVPGSAAELALQTIAQQCGIALISVQPATYGATTEIHFACHATSFGWGSDLPIDYPVTSDMVTGACTEMMDAIALLGSQTVYITTGPVDPVATPIAPPVTASVDMSSITIKECPFALK